MPEQKRCKDCGVMKSASDFYLTGRGYLRARCKPCMLVYNDQHFLGEHRTDIESIRRVRAARQSEYLRTHRVLYERSQAYRRTHPERTRAWGAVERAVAAGRLTRPDSCACGRAARVLAHHDDYTRPLDVLWLCSVCHRERHLMLRRKVVAA